MNDYIGNDISSIEWFDDRIKNLHFFEKVVLGRAKNDSNFTEPEMVDMIGNKSSYDINIIFQIRNIKHYTKFYYTNIHAYFGNLRLGDCH